ncbi:MFS transporter [Actinomadura sp. WMMB 499]|uniref:MFS transporter n=1 Tax=Actinomadura sp. WMMB 499 TaxID=1219491 RepID=UPI00159E91AE|nr:MFS transporter [Actinomadura sp. WMMB 499]
METSTASTAAAARPVPPTRRAPALMVLTACVFVVGTAEWSVVGLLPELSADLRRPLPAVGSLVTWYALVVTVAGPLVTVLMLRMPRRPALLLLLGVFTASNAAAAQADGLGVLLAARMVTALTHSTAFAVAVVIAVSMTPPAKRGGAVAVVAAGWNLATFLGAPLGTWIGDQHGWRATFACVAAAGALVLAATVILVRPPAAEGGRTGGEVRGMLGVRTATVLVVTVVAQAGLFTAYTYIAPLLRETGFAPSSVTVLLAVFGLGALGGNAAVGRLAERAPDAALLGTLAALAAGLAAFTLAAGVPWASAAGVLALGALSGLLIPLLQDRALAAAPGAPTLVASVSASAVNLGIAGGSGLGGRALAAGVPLSGLGGIGALVTLTALAIAAATVRRRPGGVRLLK